MGKKIETVLVAAVRALLEELTPETQALLVWSLGRRPAHGSR